MHKLIMTKGLPASGKSTWAKAQVLAGNGNIVRVNKDDLRKMLHEGKWSRQHEKHTKIVQNTIINTLLGAGKTVIVDNTNLTTRDEEQLKKTANDWNVQFEIQDFTDVSLEECLARDKQRQNWVGERVILEMYDKYLAPPPLPPPPECPNKNYCIIVDIDGTIAEMVDRGPFEWDKIDTDKPRLHVIRAIRTMAMVHKLVIIFLSGRDSVCYDKTYNWLCVHTKLTIYNHQLIMRKSGDTRRDSIVKREFYERSIRDNYNVMAIFDDRPQVIRECWQALGYGDRIFNVGSGKEF